MENFSEIKDFIASRCRERSACSAEFKRLMSSSTFTELLKVLTDNWWWCVNNSIFDGSLLLKFGSEALSACNVTIVDNGYHEASEGYWYADGNSTVRADGNSTVRADGNSTVSADGNSTVRAESRATINSYNSNGHEVKQYSICRYIGDWPEYKVYKVLLGSDISELIKPAENGAE